jgi:predicted aconitase with swiveling domain
VGGDVQALSYGNGEGPVVLLEEPLSLWGGLDPHTGSIIDRRHPQAGVRVSGAVLVMPGGRGSSSSSTILAEAIRAGTAPAAIVLRRPDHIIALGALVAFELYGIGIPVVVIPGSGLRDGERVSVVADGSGVSISR